MSYVQNCQTVSALYMNWSMSLKSLIDSDLPDGML